MAQKLDCVLVHTGQHYDETMSASFFADLSLPPPDMQLGVGSGSHAVQTAEIMRKFEGVLLEQRPDVVIVVGDVNSTVACALVTSKISLDSQGGRPSIAHVEAGLRSFDPAMPEEINRVITDHLSDLLFVTEESAILNLHREGIAAEKIHFVGNTMIDSLLASSDRADKSPILDKLGLRSHSNDSANAIHRYAVLTLHRPSNVDRRQTFLSILEGLDEVSQSCPVLFSAHPRTRKRIEEFGLKHFFPDVIGAGTAQAPHAQGIHLLHPLGYLDFLCLMKHSALVITDSGGIQEETTCLGVPCVTVRENTERPVTVTCGTNRLAGATADSIRRTIEDQLHRSKSSSIPVKWDGNAAARIVQTIVSEFSMRNSHSVTSRTLEIAAGFAP